MLVVLCVRVPACLLLDLPGVEVKLLLLVFVFDVWWQVCGAGGFGLSHSFRVVVFCLGDISGGWIPSATL